MRLVTVLAAVLAAIFVAAGALHYRQNSLSPFGDYEFEERVEGATLRVYEQANRHGERRLLIVAVSPDGDRYCGYVTKEKGPSQ